MVPAVVMALAVVLALVVAQVGAVAADRAQARTAADAGALAAVVAGAATATEVVSRNGAEVESITIDPSGAEVVVRVGGARASARASAGNR